MAYVNRNRAAARLRTGIFAAAALVAAPSAAFAQQTIVEQDTGIRIGSGRLNPYFEFESTYDSMAGVITNEQGEAEGKGDVILHIRPGIRFEAPSDKLQLSLKAYYDYNAYMGAEDEALTEQSKSTADIDFSALFNRDGNVRFEVTDRFVRSDRTSNLSLGVNSISNRNDASARVTAIRKGAWSITPSYTLTTETFERVDGAFNEAVYERYNHLQHTGRLDARYTIAPQTALLLNAGVSFRSYTADLENKADDVGAARILVGVGGSLLPKLGYTAKVGYGSQFGLDDAADGSTRGFSGALGLAELAYRPTELSEIRVGYARSFESDPNYDYYSDDRVYLESALALSSALGLRAGISYDAIGYGRLLFQSEAGEREDSIFRFHVGPEYRFNRYLSGGIAYALTQRSAEGEGVYLKDLYNYDRHELSARLAFVY